jgi:hypothetical protein
MQGGPNTFSSQSTANIGAGRFPGRLIPERSAGHGGEPSYTGNHEDGSQHSDGRSGQWDDQDDKLDRKKRAEKEERDWNNQVKVLDSMNRTIAKMKVMEAAPAMRADPTNKEFMKSFSSLRIHVDHVNTLLGGQVVRGSLDRGHISLGQIFKSCYLQCVKPVVTVMDWEHMSDEDWDSEVTDALTYMAHIMLATCPESILRNAEGRIHSVCTPEMDATQMLEALWQAYLILNAIAKCKDHAGHIFSQPVTASVVLSSYLTSLPRMVTEGIYDKLLQSGRNPSNVEGLSNKEIYALMKTCRNIAVNLEKTLPKSALHQSSPSSSWNHGRYNRNNTSSTTPQQSLNAVQDVRKPEDSRENRRTHGPPALKDRPSGPSASATCHHCGSPDHCLMDCKAYRALAPADRKRSVLAAMEETHGRTSGLIMALEEEHSRCEAEEEDFYRGERTTPDPSEAWEGPN